MTFIDYFKNKSYMHSFSKMPIADEQIYLDQTTIPAGHTIYSDSVRAESIPTIESIEIRDSNFLTTSGTTRVVGGIDGRKYLNILKFIDKASISVIQNSNNESYIIIDENSQRITNWISPTDAPINETQLSDGYEIILRDKTTGDSIPCDKGWVFDYFNGIIKFHESFDIAKSNVVVEGFVYVGKFEKEANEYLNQNISSLISSITEVDDSVSLIQPYKISTDKMTKVGSSYHAYPDLTLGIITDPNEYYPDETPVFQKMTFLVPGFCIALECCENASDSYGETIGAEMIHLTNGTTKITLDVPWDLNEPESPISLDSEEKMNYTFIAYSLMLKSGLPTTVNPIIEIGTQIPVLSSVNADTNVNLQNI